MRAATSLLVLAFSLAAAAPARADTTWEDGEPSRIQHDCILGSINQVEDLNWTWAGFQGLPVVGQVYYMRVSVGSLGCSGEWAIPEIKLPKATKLAISGANPVRCFYQAPGASSATQLTDGSCPTQPQPGTYPTGSSWPNSGSQYPNSFFAFAPTVSPYTWPLAPGATLIVEFPVVSDQSLSGIATNDYLLAATHVLDGNSGDLIDDGPPAGYSGAGIPSQGAWQGVFVTSSAYTGPRIVYPEPSYDMATQTTVRTYAYVYNASCVQPNEVAVSLYESDGVTDPPGSTFNGGACTLLTDGSGGSSCYFDWGGLTADTVYAWQGHFLPADVTGCGTIVQDPTMKFAKTAPAPGTTHYSLLAINDGKGTVALAPPGGSYVAGTQVSVTATGKLSHWTLDGADAGSTNPLSVTMNGSHQVVAHFASGGGKGGCGCDLGGEAATSAGGVSLAIVALASIARRRRGHAHP